jgi:diguanylate cyclase (GGDEF)-like protein
VKTRRRRRSDVAEPLALLRAVPQHHAFAALGALLGLGSPVGAFILRYWLADPLLVRAWARSELEYNFLFYCYMAFGTVAAFIVFGYTLGLRIERQKISNSLLSARVAELHIKSVTDSLTGAYTYGYLYEMLEIESQRTLTDNEALSAMIIDVDDFKRINDSHGHLFGDRVLRETAETISAHVRSEDILGRYGGDEFVVIMPGADARTAGRIAERVRAGIAKNGYRSSVSVGVATFAGPSVEAPGELLHRADMNLYQAKHDGRNCVRDYCDGPAATQRRRDDPKA